jgi:hypothetical protein
LIERVKKAIDDLPKTLKFKYTEDEIMDIIKDVYIFDKQDLKIIPGESIDKEKADKIKIIKAFENKLNLSFDETSDLIISAVEYIKKESDTSQEIKSARKEYVLKNVSKDQKTGKVTLGQKNEEKRDISEVSRTSLHEDRVFADMLIKIAAPEDIAKNLTTL